MKREDCIILDGNDPLAKYREQFIIPEKMIYLDGNSLGVLPRIVSERVAHTTLTEWGKELISSWNTHWIDLPHSVGEKIASLIGAAPGQVICTDSTSINLFKLLVTGLHLNSGRTTILSQEDNFPTDLYMAQGLAAMLGEDRCQLRMVAEDELIDALDENTAIVMLTQVNFRTGKLHDMEKITSEAHLAGALTLWDLSHSAGAMPIHLDDCEIDLAVGCGYKFLNGGPGAPAYLYVARRHQHLAMQPLSGWMGHEKPFDFSPQYTPGEGIQRFLSGTPGILGLSALDSALDLWHDVDLEMVRKKSIDLSNLFIKQLASNPELSKMRLVSPTDEEQRGSQVCFAHPEGYAVIQALIDHGVISDFREPDVLRFGFNPLYNSFVEIFDAVELLRQVITSGEYLNPKFHTKSLVT